MKWRSARPIIMLIIALLAAATLADLAIAGPFEDGLAAAQSGNYGTALRLWRPLADRGDADAQYNLGVMYNNGDGVRQDYAEALKWHRQAAAQGNGNAQFNLGLMYDQGRGMLPDYGEAARWYRLAADQGVAVAQYRLGLMYHDGQGVTRDYVQAYMWFSLAVAQFPNSDNEDRQDAIEARDLVGSKMSQIEIAKARNLALRWRIRSNQY